MCFYAQIVGFYPLSLYMGDKHVFMINIFITHAMYLSFTFFISCPEPPMGMSGVGSFPIWFGSSLNIPALLGVSY